MSRLFGVCVVFLCVCGIAWGADLPPEVPKEEPEDSSSILLSLSRGARVRGDLQVGYTYNFNDPDVQRGGNDLRLSDPDHNSFSVMQGSLGFEKQIDLRKDLDFGYALDVVVGRVADEAYGDGLLPVDGVAVGRAHVDLRVGNLTLSLGKRHGWFGLDSVDLSRNFHQSLSYAALSAPRTVTGLMGRLELAKGLSYSQYLVNGADLAIDSNDQKSLGGSLRYSTPDFTGSVNWIVGAERFDSESDLSWTLEANATFALSKSLELGGLVRYGQEQFQGDTLEFGLLQAQVKASFLDDQFVMGARASFLYDEDGLITGRGQSLLELTATAEWKPFEACGFGVEYRHDRSSEDAAFGSRSTQDTVSLFARIRF